MTPRTFARARALALHSLQDVGGSARLICGCGQQIRSTLSSGSTQLSTDSRQQQQQRQQQHATTTTTKCRPRSTRAANNSSSSGSAHTDSIHHRIHLVSVYSAPESRPESRRVLSSLGQMIYCRLSALQARRAARNKSGAQVSRAQYCLSSRGARRHRKGFGGAIIISSRQGSARAREMITPLEHRLEHLRRMLAREAVCLARLGSARRPPTRNSTRAGRPNRAAAAAAAANMTFRWRAGNKIELSHDSLFRSVFIHYANFALSSERASERWFYYRCYCSMLKYDDDYYYYYYWYWYWKTRNN